MTHGPLTGAVTSTSAQIWLRTNEPATVKVEYAPHDGSGTPATSAELKTNAESDFTAHIPIENLAPSTLYDVTVSVDGVAQAQKGQFKTFPPDDESAPFKMVIVTDFAYPRTPPTPQPDAPMRSFEFAQAEQPDLVFIGGDFDHRNPRLLPEKRQMFKDLYSDDPNSPVIGFAPFLLHQFPLAHHWDDHDFGGDNSDRTSVQRETARQVYEEYFPSYPFGEYGIYQSFKYGSDVEIFVLDERSQRDPNTSPDDEEKSMLNGEDHPDGQLDWFLDGLKNSTAKWKLVMSSSPLNETLLKEDSWARFSHEREIILNFIRDNQIGGVVFLAGDLHGGALDDGSNAGVPSVVVPGVNRYACFTVPEKNLGKWSHGVYGSAASADNQKACPGYAVVTIAGDTAKIEIKDSAGNLEIEMDLKPEDSYEQ